MEQVVQGIKQYFSLPSRLESVLVVWSQKQEFGIDNYILSMVKKEIGK